MQRTFLSSRLQLEQTIMETPKINSLEQFNRDRSPENFDKLMEEHISKVRGVIYNIVLNQADTDDICQDVFIFAFHNFNRFDHSSAFSTWLCGIAVNMANNQRRKNFTVDCRDRNGTARFNSRLHF